MRNAHSDTVYTVFMLHQIWCQRSNWDLFQISATSPVKGPKSVQRSWTYTCGVICAICCSHLCLEATGRGSSEHGNFHRNIGRHKDKPRDLGIPELEVIDNWWLNLAACQPPIHLERLNVTQKQSERKNDVRNSSAQIAKVRMVLFS